MKQEMHCLFGVQFLNMTAVGDRLSLLTVQVPSEEMTKEN